MATLTITTLLNLKELYKIDDHLWLEKTIELLKQNKLNELDVENLIEELESLDRRDKLAVRSLLEQVIRHLLLFEYWQNKNARNYRHWQAEITAFRTQLKNSLTINLTNYLNQELDKIYQDGLKYVKIKSGLNLFSDKCPYTLAQLLDEDWFPDN